MRVTPIAYTSMVTVPKSLEGSELFSRPDWDNLESSDIDLLAELAGRGCYKSFSMPNPATATNEGYLKNILDHGHYSVLEHGSVTFYVEDVSRALLLELERHRFTSYSVESQRYVNTGKYHPEPVVPPAFQRSIETDTLSKSLSDHYTKSLELYDAAYDQLRSEGFPVKKAREAARAFLLESTPVDLFVSANLRAWRDVLGKRWSEDADEEIQEFAGMILQHLKALAPNAVQDIS